MADDDDDKGTGGDLIPKSRLDREIAKRRELGASLEELRSELREAHGQIKALQPKAQGYETLTEQIADLRTKLETEQAARGEDRAIYGAGFTDPELVRFEHSRQGKDAPPLADWLGSLNEETAPASLRPFLSKGLEGTGEDLEGGQNGGEDKPKGAGKGKGTKPKGAGKAPSSGDPVRMTDARRTEILRRAQASGDWSEWRRYRTTK